MAKLTTQAKIKRLHSQGFSDRQIASVTGYSKSSVGRIRRGEQSGAKITPAVNEFFGLGKRAKQNVVSGAIPLPSAKPPAPAPARRPAKGKHPNAPKIAKAMKALLKLDAKGVDKVVVYINVPGSGKSLTLGAHGGLSINTILSAPSLHAFLEEQALRQGYPLKLLPDDEESKPGDEDWEETDLIDSIEFEEYH